MSDSDGSFQTQVASVLDALVKVASTELTKLFESRYVTLATVVLGEKQNKLQNDCLETPKADLQKPERIFRSIGVQVDERTTYASSEQSVQQDNSEGGGDCLKDCIEEVFTKDILQVEANKSSDLERPVLKENVEMKQGKFCALESSDASDSVTDDVPIEGPIPEFNHVEKPQDAEASSFSAIAPCGVSLWGRISAVKEMENCHQLKLSSADHKLLRPCSVQLVNMLLLPGERRTGGAVASRDVANNRIRISKPKDLRPHQGMHTGRRLCCFTQCGSGVWRLQEVVSHNNAGYTCKICGKRYKHRKILRRHERFHTGEKPYSCSRCSKKFALRKSLRRHERFHTGERPHTCSECGKCFHLRDNLKAHLRFHNGERPFTCSICAKSFRICRNLEKHKRSHCVSGLSSFKLIAGL